MVVGTDLGSKTKTIGAALYYIKDKIKLDSIIHQLNSKVKKD